MVNVVLHRVNPLLAGAVLRRLGVRGAPFAAMIVALHPSHAEAVAWISERKNLLSRLLFLGALLAAARAFDFAPRDEEPGEESRRPIEKRSYAVAMLLFECALLSKIVTCTVPAALAVLIWWRRGRIARAEWLALLPMVALGAGVGAPAVWVEPEDVGAEGPGIATRGEARKYASQDALWRDTVAKSPTSALARNNFGRVAFARGRLAEAREAFVAAARLDPRSPEAFFNWGSVLAAEGAIDEAVAKSEEAARAGPEWPLPPRTLAWTHATSDDARFRDAARALTLADDACRLTRNADPLALDAKAAALAAAGRFDEAARTANAAASLATRGGKPRLAREIESRAALYRSGRAFVEPVVEPEPAP